MTGCHGEKEEAQLVWSSDERMAKKNYHGKVSGKRGTGRPQLTFENTVSKILDESYVKSMWTLRRVCIKRLRPMDEAKEVCRECSVWRSVLSCTPLGIKCEAKYKKNGLSCYKMGYAA